MSSQVQSSADLSRRIEHVRAFRHAYAALVECASRFESPAGYSSFYGPREGQEREFESRAAKVGELAAAAYTAAYPMTAGTTRFGRSYEPLMQWRDPFRPDGGLASAEEVLDACDQLLGMLRVRLEEARGRERTFAYRLGRVITFPSRVRSAAGPSRAAQGAAFWGAVVVQVLGTVIAAGLLYLIGFVVARLVA